MNKKQLTDEDAYQISTNWYFADSTDVLSLRNISLGPSLQMYVYEKLFPQSQVNADTFQLKSLLKKYGFEWLTRSIASLFSDDKDKEETQALLIYDVNNNPAIDSLNCVAQRLKEDGIDICALTIDRNISRKCVTERKISWFKSFGFCDYLQAKSDSKELIKAINHNNILKNNLPLSYIFKYIMRQIPCLAREVIAIENILKEKQPKVLVMATDAHRVSRTAVQVARNLGIPSVVLQHGATIWKYGYVPVYADKILVWGRASRKWFILNGVSEDKIEVTGNVRYDTIKIPELSAPGKGKHRLYFFPNPIDRSVTTRCMQSFIQLVRKSGWDGCVKLHPSEKNIQFFKEMIPGELDSTITLSTRNIFDAGISSGDIAIIVNSTAGIDACLQGAKILNIVIDDMPNPIDYESGGVGIASEVELLDSSFDKLIAMPFEVYKENRICFLNENLGASDGNATQRACNLIENFIRKQNVNQS